MMVLEKVIRVLIVDDHNIVRKGIKALLAEKSDIQIVGEADNGLDAISLSRVSLSLTSY